uniref:hypothetical protein n=1 Tax=Gelidibacter sp. TaxID=2018083 RepID=UPI00404B8933
MIILALPFLFYLYKLSPDVTIWKTKYFTLSTNHQDSIQIFFWLLSKKVLTLSILFIWFFTCKHWWRYIILFPLIIEIYKFLGFLDVELEFMNVTFINTLVYSIPLCIILIFITNKWGYYNKSKSFNQQLTQEIDQLFSELSNFKKENYTKANTDYKHLLKEKDALSKEDYLQKLIVIRDGLTPSIKNNP